MNGNAYVYRDIVRHYGAASQMNMLQEECGELIAAVNHYRRGRIEPLELADEIADVMIMCEQMSVVLGDIVEKRFNFKHSKLVDRLCKIEGIER